MRTPTNISSVSAARPGSCGNASTLLRLIDTATNRRPVSAAAAPTSATKKLSQPAVAWGFISPQRNTPKNAWSAGRRSVCSSSSVGSDPLPRLHVACDCRSQQQRNRQVRLHFKDDLYDAQLLRAVGHATYRGAEIGECLATVEPVKEQDADGWYDAWMKTAARVHALADESLAAGRAVSARDGYLRASNYYRTAYVFLLRPPLEERVTRAYDLQSATFRSAAALFGPAFEFVRIPYDGAGDLPAGDLPAYVARVDDQKRPLV